MLITYLEREASLIRLSRTQLLAVETYFTMYLIQAITFRQALLACDRVLDEDQADLRAVMKQKLANMIGDADCNSLFKPAILRLAGGDATGFRHLGENPRRVRNLIAAHPREVRARLAAVAYSTSQIGPRHLNSQLEAAIRRVEPHAKSFIRKHAEFLSMGESTLERGDLVRELVLIGVRSYRWYYPFLQGLHADNTTRRTITNRGRSLIKFYTADHRRRLVQDEKGVSYNRESTQAYDVAVATVAAPGDPAKDSILRIGLRKASEEKGPVGRLATFFRSPEQRDALLDQIIAANPAARGSSDIAEALTRTQLDYSLVLSRFLKMDEGDVRSALTYIRSRVA